MCLIYLFLHITIQANIMPHYHFKRLTSLEGLPCNDIQKIYQSPDGYIWLASKNGFYRYDGYSFKTYKSNLYHPTLLSNNNILCLEEDLENRLWIGTDKGLNVLLRKTGEIKQQLYFRPLFHSKWETFYRYRSRAFLLRLQYRLLYTIQQAKHQWHFS